jgi:alpha-galactosidase
VVAGIVTVAIAAADQSATSISAGIYRPSFPANSHRAYILTPKSGSAAHINSPCLFGVRPGHPVLFTVDASGERPMRFTAVSLPAGLKLNARTGMVAGVLHDRGIFRVTLHATNATGMASQRFKIVVGSSIALTPPMGWNPYNAFSNNFDEKLIMRQSRDLVRLGLNDYGWTYICIDDGWQGKRTGPDHAMEPNKRFDDMAGMIKHIHAMGLKFGIYSTPWVTSYAQYPGGSADNPQGLWHKPKHPEHGYTNGRYFPWIVGRYSFDNADARQWAAWGVDYLKYDWYPNRYAQIYPMYEALRHSGRDIVLSLSNNAPYKGAAKWTPYANLWRTTGDVRDNWKSLEARWLTQPKWAPLAGPGHWNDPDMMTIGWVGWGRLRPTFLTPNEQYTEVSAYCLMAAPLILGCDLHHMDAFTRSLITNEEVLSVDQDALGVEGVPVNPRGAKADRQVWAKDLASGSLAVGLFNLGSHTTVVSASWQELKLHGPQQIRDLWRQKTIGVFNGEFAAQVPSHGVVLVRITAVQ